MSVLVPRPSSPLPHPGPGSYYMGEPWIPASASRSNLPLLKVQTDQAWRSVSQDLSGGDLSASFTSHGNSSGVPASGSLSGPTPVLIPTPSMPDAVNHVVSEEASGTARSGASSPFTGDEVLSIMRAEKLFGLLRHRFDCQPDRLENIRLQLRRWLERIITTAELDERVRSHLTGDHPADAQILEDFGWFVRSSYEYYERQRSSSPSPRCAADATDPDSTECAASVSIHAAGSSNTAEAV